MLNPRVSRILLSEWFGFSLAVLMVVCVAIGVRDDRPSTEFERAVSYGSIHGRRARVVPYQRLVDLARQRREASLSDRLMVKVPARSILPLIRFRDALCITHNPVNGTVSQGREGPARAWTGGCGTMQD
jgi:hypothetical protein